ncbi:MAG: hypothetical protein ABJR46_10710 [Tateyamaria sp.]|uniref:hypothetical protein n=1 Tax=Tateyamaria sp. TaxID=1929288 RepID=UPI0032938166
MTALVAAFLSTQWFCTSPLALPIDPLMIPVSPVTLTLTAGDDGSFHAIGEMRADIDARPVRWSGSWSVFDAQLAMIGPWETELNTVEVRGFSNVVRADVLLMTLREGDHKGLSLRCLQHQERAE